MMTTPSLSAIDGWSLGTVDLRDVYKILRRQWPVIVASVLMFTLLSTLIFSMIEPRYDAKAEVLLEPPKHRALSQDDHAPDSVLLDSSVVDSQVPLILSSRNLAHVVLREHLADDPEFKNAASAGSSEFDAAQDDPNHIDPRLTPIIMHLVEHIDVTRVAKSNVVAIRVSSHNPAKAARLANVIAESYVADQVDFRVKVVQQAATLFGDRLDFLRAQVRSSENALAAYRKTNGMVTTADEKITISDQQLSNLNERLAFAASESALKLAKYEQAVKFENGAGDLSTLSDIIQSPVITQLRSQLAEVQRREADLLSVYGPSYPDVIRLRAQIQVLEHALVTEIHRLVSMLKNDYQVSKLRETSLRDQVTTLVAPSGVAADAGVELRELQRTNLANKALFDNFLNKAKLTQEESTFELPDSRIISPALTPSKPAFPKIQVILPIGAIIGLVSGMIAAFCLETILAGRIWRYRFPRFPRPQPAM